MSEQRPYVLACLQTDPRFGDVAGNIARQRELLEEAAAAGAKLAVLPECSTTGYMFEDAAEAAELAETLGDGPASALWTELATRHDLHIVAGFVERAGDAVFNSVAVVGPQGILGRYRKLHLWNFEKELYSPGDVGMPLFDTPLGRIATHVCYDAWFPETFRLPAVQGADLICAASNWLPNPHQQAELPSMARMVSMAAASSNLVFVATASRAGVERGQPFIGDSIVVDWTGWPIACAGAGEEVLYAEVDPVGSREQRANSPFNQPLRDRRTDVYAELLGAAAHRNPQEAVKA